jgi:hypothetical protein
MGFVLAPFSQRKHDPNADLIFKWDRDPLYRTHALAIWNTRYITEEIRSET